MKNRPLAVTGAAEFVPDLFEDDRGFFVSPFDAGAYRAAAGNAPFELGQVSLTRSHRGVVRGIHYSRAAPGAAKYVFCPAGKVLDFVVDLRVGSPTFGTWDVVELSSADFRAVYVPAGVGHAVAAVEEGSLTCYQLPSAYRRGEQLAISVWDPTIQLRLPAGDEHLVSERDRRAPTLAEAMDAGLLPEYSGDHSDGRAG